jgi:hypothetical protein
VAVPEPRARRIRGRPRAGGRGRDPVRQDGSGGRWGRLPPRILSSMDRVGTRGIEYREDNLAD